LEQVLLQVLLAVDMQLEQTVPIQFLMQLQPQAVVVVATTVAALVSEAVVAVVVGVVGNITQVVAAVEPEQPEETHQCRQILAANTALVFLDKDIPVVEVAAIFTLQVKAAAV
jgi:hypothetical protein